MGRNGVVLSLLVLLVSAWPAAAQIENHTVPVLRSSAWYWTWGTMLGTTAVILAICFKHPKRSHDN